MHKREGEGRLAAQSHTAVSSHQLKEAMAGGSVSESPTGPRLDLDLPTHV